MKKLFNLVIPLAFLLTACTTSRITTSWNQQEPPVHFNRILVVGLFDEGNRALRQQMEDQLAGDLQRLGYRTVTSLSEYGPSSFEKMSPGQALREIRSKDIDGVITIGLVDTARVKKYVSNYGYRPYTGWRYNPWYGWVYRPYYMPGFRSHYETDVRYLFETNLYDVRGKRLIYSAQTQSDDPSNIDVMADDYSKTVVRDIRKKNVLGS